MPTTTCPTTISLSRPLYMRVLDAVEDTLVGWADAWHAHAEQHRRKREMLALADMNELLLRDIGAPEWLVAEANSRREVERQRLLELNQSRRDLVV